MKNIYCECPEVGKLGCDPSWYDPITELSFTNHEPNECKCTNDIKTYIRNGKTLNLCSICNMWGDKLVVQ